MQFDPKPRCGGSVVSFTVMLLLIIGADFAAGRPGSRISSSSSEEPQLVLVPPADRSEAASGSDSHFGPNPGQLTHPTSNSVTPFAARFEPSASSSSSQSVEPFPPSKVEYTKSDEGKVISTPVTNNQRKTETVAPPASNTGKYTGGFGAPPGLLRPQSTNPSGSNSNPRPGSDIYVAGNQHEFSSVLKANKARPTVNPGRYKADSGRPREFFLLNRRQIHVPSSQLTSEQRTGNSHPVATGGRRAVLVDHPAFSCPSTTCSELGGSRRQSRSPQIL
ncbi:GD25145 [Drosophila simulans]|uniref:GD25145 n=1 Tax=Drosophila simulans TaxID=7240 RepID=B4QH19_DROSI|nr:GD25145 [Drosophila simulans]